MDNRENTNKEKRKQRLYSERLLPKINITTGLGPLHISSLTPGSDSPVRQRPVHARVSLRSGTHRAPGPAACSSLGVQRTVPSTLCPALLTSGPSSGAQLPSIPCGCLCSRLGSALCPAGGSIATLKRGGEALQALEPRSSTEDTGACSPVQRTPQPRTWCPRVPREDWGSMPGKGSLACYSLTCPGLSRSQTPVFPCQGCPGLCPQRSRVGDS